jgi:restriction endonuclease S subunit
MTRLRYVVRLNPSKSEAGDLGNYEDVTFAPMEALADGLGGLDLSLSRPALELGENNYSYFAEGDLLLAKVTPCFENGKKALAVGLPNRIGFATSEVHVIRPDARRLDTNYLRYLLSSEPFRAAGVASMTGAGGLKRISDGAIKDFRLPIADINIQKAIAAFLDRETGHIDQLIATKERFLSLIEEKRTALIERAINGTLLHRPTQTGPSHWFGRVPGNWTIKRARYLFRERLELSDQGIEELLTVSHITGVTARSEKDVNMFLAETLEGYKLVHPGDLVVNTMWAWMGAMGVSAIAGCASPSYAVYRPLSNSFNNQYLDLLVRAASFIAEVNRRSKGIWASRLRLYPDAFLDILIPVPPLDEQRATLSALSTAIGREEKIAKLSRASVEQLKSRRASLITAAVTGQIDVHQQPIAVATKADRSRFRVIIGAEIVQRHKGTAKFGRVKLQKELYLAEAHAGITELQGTYFREAAGPLDRTLVEETERGMEASAFSRANLPDIHARNGGVTYSPLAKAGQHRAELEKLLGPRAKALRHIIELLRDFDTRAVEAIATLYAVWNDALIDSETLDDNAIVHAVLNEWHPEKQQKFKETDLRHWLAWMKRNGLVPTGKGPRTISTTSRDMFT